MVGFLLDRLHMVAELLFIQSEAWQSEEHRTAVHTCRMALAFSLTSAPVGPVPRPSRQELCFTARPGRCQPLPHSHRWEQHPGAAPGGASESCTQARWLAVLSEQCASVGSLSVCCLFVFFLSLRTGRPCRRRPAFAAARRAPAVFSCSSAGAGVRARSPFISQAA